MKFLFLVSLLGTTAAIAAELPANIAKVYSYECEATFLEGEGVKEQELLCEPFQQLGLLKARYHHYFFRSATASNADKKSTGNLNPDSMCNLELHRFLCTENLPELKFGLSAEQNETYSVAVKLSPAPELPAEIQGYAAPAVKGKCAEGLQLVQAYRAAPKTIQSPLPTNFVNAHGNLDDILVLPPQKKAPRFEVQRMRNNGACDDSGSCATARFDEAVGIQRVDYKAGISVCVVPKSALSESPQNLP